MKIGKLARDVGVNIQTVRYYERRGLLQDPRGTAPGYREYDGSTANRLRFIRRAQELGFTLDEITELLALRLDPNTTAHAVKERARAKIEEVDSRIHDLEHIRDALNHLAGTCSGDHVPNSDCPFLESLGAIA